MPLTTKQAAEVQVGDRIILGRGISGEVTAIDRIPIDYLRFHVLADLARNRPLAHLTHVTRRDWSVKVG